MASNISGSPQLAFSHPVKPSLNHRLRRRRPSPRIISSSSGLSSILATFAASSLTVDGSPLTFNRTPPPFLCPFIEPGDNIAPSALARLHVPADPSGSLSPSSSSKLKHILSKRGTIPDKYQQGPNGEWYRVEEYTLYGSTVCPHCELSYTTSSIIQSPTTLPTPSVVMPDILDQLPTGWRPPTGRGSRTTLILALSLALAFFICFFMTACIIWRKNKTRISRKRDEEMRMRKLRRGDEQRDSESLVEREAKVNRDLWARATARWKANARYMARQRRGNRRYSRHTSIHRSSMSADPPDNTSTPPSPVPSRSASRGPPLSTHENSPRSSISSPNPVPHSTPNPIAHIPNDLPPPNSALLSPPAYHPRTILTSPRMPKSPECIYVSDHESLENLQTPPPSHIPDADILTPFSPSFYTAHVATDDKAIIAQMASYASSPETGGLGAASGAQVSVPIWQDEDLEDYTQLSCPGSSKEISSPWPPHHSSESPFPPPPSQEKAATDPFYDYVYSYEDLDVAEREIGPSAPPFEEGCANIASIDITPSAPPLLEEAHQSDLNPSAPDLDGDPPESGEAQVHDREANSTHTHEEHLSYTLDPLSAVPIACDAALPCYHA